MPKIHPRVTVFDAGTNVFEYPNLETAIRALLPLVTGVNARYFQHLQMEFAIGHGALRFFDDYGDRINPDIVLEALAKIFQRRKPRRQPYRAGPIAGARRKTHRWRQITTTGEIRANAAFSCDMAELRLCPGKIGRRRYIPSQHWDDYTPRSCEKSWKKHRPSQWKNNRSQLDV